MIKETALEPSRMSSNSISATEKDFSREPPPMKSLVKILGFLMQQPSSFVLEQLRVIDGIGLNETQGKQSLLRDDCTYYLHIAS
jgi:hypothetical protein